MYLKLANCPSNNIFILIRTIMVYLRRMYLIITDKLAGDGLATCGRREGPRYRSGGFRFSRKNGPYVASAPNRLLVTVTVAI